MRSRPLNNAGLAGYARRSIDRRVTAARDAFPGAGLADERCGAVPVDRERNILCRWNVPAGEIGRSGQILDEENLVDFWPNQACHPFLPSLGPPAANQSSLEWRMHRRAEIFLKPRLARRLLA